MAGKTSAYKRSNKNVSKTSRTTSMVDTCCIALRRSDGKSRVRYQIQAGKIAILVFSRLCVTLS